MEAIALYCLKSGALLAAFFLAYYVFLRKETFFSMNRWYLLAGLVTSAVLPLLEFEKVVYVAPKVIEEIPIEAYELPASLPPDAAIAYAAEVPAPETFDWFLLIPIAYGIITALLLLKLTIEFFQLRRLLKNKNANATNGFRLYDIPANIAPFSYFKSIVYNSSLYSEEELLNILQHERVHSLQWHSIDVLLSRLFCIAFWWNPVSWFYHKAIIQNLEFIADSEAIRQISDKRSYQYTLLKITTPATNRVETAISNHFFQSLIKKRIVMLNTNQSSKWQSWKYVLILPVLAAFLLGFQVRTITLEKPLEAIAKALAPQDEINILIKASTTDDELKQMTAQAKAEGIKLKFSKVKRNDRGQITAIKAEFKDKYGKSGVSHVEGSEPITPIRFYKDNTGLAGFGTPRDIRFKLNHGDDSEADEVAFAYAIEVPEAPEAPEAPESPEVPEAPEAPEIDVVRVPTEKNKMIVITTKDGKVQKYVSNGSDMFTFDTNELIADIDADDIAEISIVANEYANGVRLQADAYNLTDMSKLSKATAKQVRDAMKVARDEMRKARPEIERAREEVRRAFEDNRVEIERASKETEKDLARAKGRSEVEKARAEMQAAMDEARKEMAEARKEMEKARAELEKERAKMAQERAKK